MRRRDRMEGHIWLSWSGEESKARHLQLDSSHERGIADSMDVLIRRYRLLVVCDVDGERYSVRCYPVPGARSRGLPYYATSYCGLALDKLLAAAVYEYDMVQGGDWHYDCSNAETVRWVE